MTKKKPDFLRDLDTAIMDELTGGGIKGNAAGLVGTLTQIKEIKQLCGLPFCGYMAKLETVRPSGVPDEVTVVFAEDVPYRACNGIEFDVMQEFVEGSRLLLTGKVQTLKDFQSGRLLVYILADFVAVSEKAVEQDEAAVRGVIANKPTYRETPRGKRITDITVKVRNELTGGSCFLPCICWQEQADEAAQWQQGDTVELLGRYQSRQYEKVLDTATGEREQRTAYEVSVRLIRRKEEADGATKMRQITVGIHGKGGEAGIKAIQQLAGMVDSLKQCQTPQEVYDRYLQITGYCKCCVDCNFIDQKGADELMCLAAYLAGNEQARAEAQQKAGKKA